VGLIYTIHIYTRLPLKNSARNAAGLNLSEMRPVFVRFPGNNNEAGLPLCFL